MVGVPVDEGPVAWKILFLSQEGDLFRFFKADVAYTSTKCVLAGSSREQLVD